MYIFNPEDWTFESTSGISLPRPRYRHCAEIVNNHLWLLGGRSVEDDLISEVDVRVDGMMVMRLTIVVVFWAHVPLSRAVLIIFLDAFLFFVFVAPVQVYDLAEKTWSSFTLPRNT